MKITNHANLPAPLVRAIQMDPYDSSSVDYSTTTLIKPPRIVALERQHKEELTEDASDRIWALMGQLGHLVLERAGMGELVELRFIAERIGKKIGGQVDLWLAEPTELKPEFRKSGILIDYKFCSQWAAKDGVKPEWEQQMNINALLCRENGVGVKEAQIVAIYRDWSVGEARRNKDYPQHQVQVWVVKLWPQEQQESWVCNRIQMHLDAAKTLPECTPMERWARPEKWAVMKPGREKALKLHDTRQDAIDHVNNASSNHKLFVEHRPGVQTRCEDYCAVSQWCEQFKQLKQQPK